MLLQLKVAGVFPRSLRSQSSAQEVFQRALNDFHQNYGANRLGLDQETEVPRVPEIYAAFVHLIAKGSSQCLSLGGGLWAVNAIQVFCEGGNDRA